MKFTVIGQRMLHLSNKYLNIDKVEEFIEDKTILIYFTFNEEALDIVDPFILGQYSQINKDYKSNWFNKAYLPKTIKDPARKHAVIYNKPMYKALLAKEFDVAYSLIKECESIPQHKDEIRGFVSYYDNISDDFDNDSERIGLKIKEAEMAIKYCEMTPWDIKSEQGIKIDTNELV